MDIRILAYVFAGLLCMGLAGCNGDERNAGDTIEDATESTAEGVEDLGEGAEDMADDVEDRTEDAMN